ncbi:hypothetical protein [Legionella sp. CNM-4043-24]|uniref:hypothetical protein n=1 Tax=Legionella sp. CNM-4043-24 TaxID=3421646 RepID=UPI00403B1377
MTYTQSSNPDSNELIKSLAGRSANDIFDYFNSKANAQARNLFKQDKAVQDFVYLKMIQDPLQMLAPALDDRTRMSEVLGQLKPEQIDVLHNRLSNYHLLELYKINPAFGEKSLAMMGNNPKRQERLIQARALFVSSDRDLDALHDRLNNKELKARYKMDIGFAERSLARLQTTDADRYEKMNSAYLKNKNRVDNAYTFNQGEYLKKYPLLKNIDGACFGFTLNWLATDKFHKRLLEAKETAKGDLLNPVMRRVVAAQYRQELFEREKAVKTMEISDITERKAAATAIIQAIIAKPEAERALLYTQDHVMGLRIRHTDKGTIKIQYYDSNPGKRRIAEFNPNDPRATKLAAGQLSAHLKESNAEEVSMSLHSRAALKTFISTQEKAPATNSRLDVVAEKTRAEARRAALEAIAEQKPTRAKASPSSSTSAARSSPPEPLSTNHKKNSESPSAGTAGYGTASAVAKRANNSPAPDERSPLLQANIKICYTFREKMYNQQLIVRADATRTYNYITNTALAGGELKEHILQHFARALAPFQGDRVALEAKKAELLQSEEGRLLKQGQNWFTKKTGIKTDSVKALDKIVDDLAKMEPVDNYQRTLRD